MRGTDPMNRRRGSAIVLSMLLLVILSALGMYAVSVPVGTGESAGRHHRAAVARNMARAGANAAIARFPVVSPGGSPYVRRIPVGSNVTGRYSVTSRKAGTEIGPGSGRVRLRGVRPGLRGERDRCVPREMCVSWRESDMVPIAPGPGHGSSNGKSPGRADRLRMRPAPRGIEKGNRRDFPLSLIVGSVMEYSKRRPAASASAACRWAGARPSPSRA